MGDARNPEDVRAALKGAYAVIQALGIPANARMLTGPIDLFSAATATLLPLMQDAGVRRLISVTGFGAGESRAAIGPLQRIGFDLVFGRAYADKDIQEQLISKSELDWVIVRPGVLINHRWATSSVNGGRNRWSHAGRTVALFYPAGSRRTISVMSPPSMAI